MVSVTLERLTYNQACVKVRLTECPCGHVFDDDADDGARPKHFLEDHDPEDFGLDSPASFAADGGAADDV